MAAALLIGGTVCSCAGESRAVYADLGSSPPSEDDSGWQVLDSGVAEMQNGRVQFRMDVATTHFTVTDLTTQKVYESVPSQAVATAS